MKRTPAAEEDMHAKGYALAGDVAAGLRIARSTVTRWADDGKVREIRYLSGRYVEVESVVKHMNLDNVAAARLRQAVFATPEQKQRAAAKEANAVLAVEPSEGGPDGDPSA